MSRVAVSLLCWNTREVSRDARNGLVLELGKLLVSGHEAYLITLDNGSDDWTATMLNELHEKPYFRAMRNSQNLGNAVARNQIIDAAAAWDADYLLLLDGDIQPVAGSVLAMVEYLEQAPPTLACIGAFSGNQTAQREEAVQQCDTLRGRFIARNTHVAWTQYGLFRMAPFQTGVRFDENFGPGWGFEDNDLMYQLQEHGYTVEAVLGMTYLHRAIRSSCCNLEAAGLNPAELFEQRKQYLLDKWHLHPVFAAHEDAVRDMVYPTR